MVTVIIKYKGTGNNAKNFVNEMLSSGLVDTIRQEEGNLRYEYCYPLEDEESVILIDSWVNQEALDIHHQLPLMKRISELREKYDLHMKVYRFISDDAQSDESFIRK